MKLLVAGSRTITDYPKVAHILSNASYLLDRHVTEVIEGGARGVDSLAKRWALERGYPVREMPADWDRYGRQAGYIRNQQMVTACDAGIVVWDGVSRGSKNTMTLLHRSAKPYVVVTLHL